MNRPPIVYLAVFLFGVVAIVFQIVLGSILISYLHPALIMFAFILGVPLGIAVTRNCPELTFPAMGLFAIIVVVPALQIDVPLSGHVVNLRRANTAFADCCVAGFVAPDWHLAVEYANDEELTAGSENSCYGQQKIAPLVRSGWTPELPVEVWVVAETLNTGRMLPWNPDVWNADRAEYVRRTGHRVFGSQLAAQRAATKFNLKTSSEPLIVMRVPSVTGAKRRQYATLGISLLVVLLAWTLIVALYALVPIAFRRCLRRRTNISISKAWTV